MPPPTEEQTRAEHAKAEDDHYLSAATVWLAAFTAVLAGIAGLQLGLFLRQLRLSERASRDSEMAAKAAKASADALPKIERAYVFVEVTGLHFERTVDGASRVDVDMTFTNHGKTPAIVKRLRAYPQWADSPPIELIRAKRSEEHMPEGMVIGAGKDLIIGQMRTLGRDETRDLLDVVWSVYFVGVIEYEDIMGTTHHTGYCWSTYPSDESVKINISPSPLNYFD